MTDVERCVVAFSDLDRTLIYSRSAVTGLAGGGGVPDVACVEIHDGKQASFVTTGAVDVLTALAETGMLVPTTTRTVKQYRRITLPGPLPRFAICANGGRLVVDGVVDHDFSREVEDRLAGEGAPLGEVLDEVRRLAATEPAVERVRVASDLFCYLIVERDQLPAGWLEELTGYAAYRAWGVSLQGRKLYVVPRSLTKSAAGGEVVRRLGATSAVAAGDSLLDADLLDWADRSIRPAHGELGVAGWSRSHLEVAGEPGVRAGEEIARWLLGQVRPERQVPPIGN